MPDQLSPRTYTIGVNLTTDVDGTTLTIPLDLRNNDYQRALAELGRDHASVSAEVNAARQAARTTDDSDRTKRKNSERASRQAVKSWLASMPGAPSLKQFAEVMNSVADDS